MNKIYQKPTLHPKKWQINSNNTNRSNISQEQSIRITIATYTYNTRIIFSSKKKKTFRLLFYLESLDLFTLHQGISFANRISSLSSEIELAFVILGISNVLPHLHLNPIKPTFLLQLKHLLVLALVCAAVPLLSDDDDDDARADSREVSGSKEASWVTLRSW